MKLLIVSQYFWPEEFRINELTKDFVEKGHEVTVLTAKPNYPEGKIFNQFRDNPKAYSMYEGCNIYRVPIIPRGKNRFTLALNYLSFIITGTIGGYFYFSKVDFDKIFVFSTSPITACIPAIFIKWRKRIPLTIWVLDLWPQTLSALGILKNEGYPIKIVGQLVKFIYKQSDLILGQSKSFVEEIQKFSDSKEKVKYFPNWIESAYLKDEYNYAKEIDKDNRVFKIIFAGNIGEAQDFPTIIKALDLIDESYNLVLYIIGDGRKKEWLYNEIKSRKIENKVKLLGRFPNFRMPEFFLHADALLVSLKPSEVFDKTIPGKLQSYLISKKPVLGILQGEGKRIIEDSNAGKTVIPGDYMALTDAIKEFYNMDQFERTQIGNNGYEYAKENFDKQRIFSNLESMLLEV